MVFWESMAAFGIFLLFYIPVLALFLYLFFRFVPPPSEWRWLDRFRKR